MLHRLTSWIAFDLFGYTPASPIGISMEFFLYETIKIFLLLLVITHLMGVLRFYLPIERMRSFLASRRLFGADYFLSSLFGAVTPFCSCSSIPLFMSFLQARIPLGLTFAFLITSPLINEVALVLFAAAFGWQITVLYATFGILIGMAGGFILGKMNLEKEIASDFRMTTSGNASDQDKRDVITALKVGSREARAITRKVMPYVLIGVGAGALIHGHVPEGYFETILSGNALWTVPLAVVLAVPLYANASAVVPIAAVLVEKGVALGTALAFMMAVVGLSLPEAMILKRVMSMKLLLLFFGVVTVGIIAVGYGMSAFT